MSGLLSQVDKSADSRTTQSELPSFTASQETIPAMTTTQEKMDELQKPPAPAAPKQRSTLQSVMLVATMSGAMLLNVSIYYTVYTVQCYQPSC